MLALSCGAGSKYVLLEVIERVDFVEAGALTMNLSSPIEPLASYLASLKLSPYAEMQE